MLAAKHQTATHTHPLPPVTRRIRKERADHLENFILAIYIKSPSTVDVYLVPHLPL